MSFIGRLLRRRDTAPEKDPLEPLYRAQLIQLHVNKLADEARRCGDPLRVQAISEEIQVCVDNLREIHAEQLRGFVS